MKKYINRVECIVDLGCIEANVEAICAGLPTGTKVCAVVKADAYGHGATAVARYLKDRVDFFAVATAAEAMELREVGITNPVLILGYVWPEDYPELIRNEIRIPIFKEKDARMLALAAQIEGKKAIVHIKVDTGMNRIGFKPDEESAAIVRDICQTQWLDTEGIFTHFARADEEDKTSARGQLELFKNFISQVEKDGIRIRIHHCANSAASMEMPDAAMDMVRLGIAMYGLYPSGEVSHAITLRPAMSLISTIVFIKEVPEGDGISYNHTHILDRPCRVATIPVGYGDGYPRLLSDKGSVLIRGKRARILGRICMDQLMVDVTNIPEAEEGGRVVLVGADGSDMIPVEELSDICGIFNYEFICRLSLRIPRIYTG
ncbi:MAG: alanine racemase [Lachnospiraceae bacterium]|nr:alanine racemase [Lachnospiraceae bacterium]